MTLKAIADLITKLNCELIEAGVVDEKSTDFGDEFTILNTAIEHVRATSEQHDILATIFDLTHKFRPPPPPCPPPPPVSDQEIPRL